MSIFKAYDIRGKYPSELDETKARAIGWALVQFLKSRRRLTGPLEVAVGRDVRLSSASLSESVIEGLLQAGAKATDIGRVTTPMLYFASGFYQFDASVMVTASHNPAEYNGFKICREKAIALSENTGLVAIKEISEKYKHQVKKKSSAVNRLNVLLDYQRFIRRFIRFSYLLIKVAIDTTNGSVGRVFENVFDRVLLKRLGLKIIRLYFKPDGRFPNHEPNPMKDENLSDIKRVIRNNKADLGVCFDGDGDRIIFLDERAKRVSNDLITALIAKEILREHKHSAVVYDLRSSKVVKEEIERRGGIAIRERVGHAFIKATMRQHNAVFGGELSGHYYYLDNFFADSALLTFVYILNIIARENKRLSAIIKPLRRYFQSGEMNFTVTDKDARIEKVISAFSDGMIDYLDGVTVAYDTWWFNLRPSNTEPLLRLNIEATTEKQLTIVKNKIIKLLS
jgi:phosphomannomutase